MFRDVNKLPAGSILRFCKGEISITRYWIPEFAQDKIKISMEKAVDRLQEFMETSVKLRLVSDVPVGAFLSGGVDSSIVVAIMARLHSGPLHTFCIGFDSDKDETRYAAEVARLFDTVHHEITCKDSDFEDLDRIIWHLDEPIGDAIILPTYLLAKAARQQVKVVLSGEGADEVFGGYLFHKTLLAVCRYKKYIPGLVRWMGRETFSRLPHGLINKVFEYPADLGEDGKTKLMYFLNDIEHLPIPALYRSLMTLFSERELAFHYTPDFVSELRDSGTYFSDQELKGNNDLDKILNVQYRDWLPDLIMMRLDKMTMANSLEGREPYLDHKMFHFASSLPDNNKVKCWKEKLILRKLGERYLPKNIIYRKKTPFYIPLEEYFQRPTFKKLYESFREENYLKGIFEKSFLENLNLENTGLMKSKQLFSLIVLNRWFKLFIH
jgi:asparagine synthase (glutamine-hydrolysing)